jgi:CRISPR-associated protein Cmr5
MSVHTRSQRLAQEAFPRIRERLTEKRFKEYMSFSKKFPALVHTCGLAQAVAFALAKQEVDYIADLTAVLRASGHAEITEREPLEHHARTVPLSGYMRLSRDTINAASWLKRYAEALAPEDTEEARHEHRA